MVIECYYSCTKDFYFEADFIKVRNANSASLMELMRTCFSQIPNIISTRTTIALKTVKEHQKVIIPQTNTNEPAN